MRGRAWQHLSGSKKLKDENEGVFGVSSIPHSSRVHAIFPSTIYHLVNIINL